MDRNSLLQSRVGALRAVLAEVPAEVPVAVDSDLVRK